MKETWNSLKYNLLIYKNKIGLKNRNFTIISNNCWGGFVYQKYGIRYQTPFIGLFLFAPDYIKLLKNFENIIFSELSFISFQESKYKEYLNKDKIYPIGILDNNIELHFLHYKSQKEAKEKWDRRVKRINLSNILFKFSDRDLCDYSLLKDFENLKYKNKICFVAKEYTEFESCIFLKQFRKKTQVEAEWIYYEEYVNIKQLLNNLTKEDREYYEKNESCN